MICAWWMLFKLSFLSQDFEMNKGISTSSIKIIEKQSCFVDWLHWFARNLEKLMPKLCFLLEIVAQKFIGKVSIQNFLNLLIRRTFCLPNRREIQKSRILFENLFRSIKSVK